MGSSGSTRTAEMRLRKLIEGLLEEGVLTGSSGAGRVTPATAAEREIARAKEREISRRREDTAAKRALAALAGVKADVSGIDTEQLLQKLRDYGKPAEEREESEDEKSMTSDERAKELETQNKELETQNKERLFKVGSLKEAEAQKDDPRAAVASVLQLAKRDPALGAEITRMIKQNPKLRLAISSTPGMGDIDGVVDMNLSNLGKNPSTAIGDAWRELGKIASRHNLAESPEDVYLQHGAKMKINESKFRSIIRDEARRLYEGESRFPQGRGHAEQAAAYDEAADRYDEVWPDLVQVVKDLLEDEGAPADLAAYITSNEPDLYDRLLELAGGDEDLLDEDLEIIFEELAPEIERDLAAGEAEEEEFRTRRGDYGGFIPEGRMHEARKKSKSVVKKGGKKASAGSVAVFKKAAAKAKGGEEKKKGAGFKAVRKSAEKWADNPAAVAQAATMVATGEPVVAKGEKRKKIKESAFRQIISQEITSLLREGLDPFSRFSEKYKDVYNFDSIINRLADKYFNVEYTSDSFSDYVKGANNLLYDEMLEIAGDEGVLQDDLDDWYREMEGEIRAAYADSEAVTDPYKFHGVSRSDFYPKPPPKRRY